MENLVDEVMREELASLRCQYNSSPGSESSSDKESLTPGHAICSLSETKLEQGSVLIRLPLHLSENISLSLDPGITFRNVKKVTIEANTKRFSTPDDEHSQHLACKVCGARAGKHSYYGGQVCPSCRPFFRRSVQTGYNEKFKCKRGKGSCEITLITRKNCQSCRYQRCIYADMRPSWILSDEERERRFHGQDKGKGHKAEKHGSDLEHKTSDDFCKPKQMIPQVNQQQDHYPHNPMTADDRLQILQYGEVMRSCCAGRHDDMDPQMVTELLQIALHGTSLSHQTAAQLHTVVENRTSQCFYLLQEFQALLPDDQDQIVQHNLQMIHRFRQAIWWGNTKYDCRWLVGMFIGEDKCLQIENVPQNFSLTNSSFQPFEYQSLFISHWCQSEEVEVLHKNLMKEISNTVDSDDEIEIILIVLIIAFSADFLDLKDRNQVEKIQLKFVLFLQSHYSAIYP
jgi:hypothetical protein